jgi:hypothetical protein
MPKRGTGRDAAFSGTDETPFCLLSSSSKSTSKISLGCESLISTVSSDMRMSSSLAHAAITAIDGSGDNRAVENDIAYGHLAPL